jgi:SAM-dependent methyltransferase
MKTVAKRLIKSILYPPYYCLKRVAPRTAKRLKTHFLPYNSINLTKENTHDLVGRKFSSIARKVLQLEEDIQRVMELQYLTLIKLYQPSFKIITHSEPSFEQPVSQLATERQLHSSKFQFWRTELHLPSKMMHRKLWEFCYILQVLEKFDFLKNGKRGLGFGVGIEPLPALFAKYGCHVVATDQDYNAAETQGWTKTNQHSFNKDKLNDKNICASEQFEKLVDFQTVDMKSIPSDLREFDFVWSCCSLEHLGNLEEGMKFIKNSMDCLKPGGVAIHTTEFNVSSNTSTVEEGATVLYRRQDILKLTLDLMQMGCQVLDLNFNTGSLELDQYVDLPPYNHDRHIKLQLLGYTTTSIGIVVKKL